MADIKINDLTALTDPSSNDVLPIVDIGNDATKKVTIADLLENAGAGAEATPGISFNNDSDTGIYRPGGNRVGVCTAGVERIRIDNNGRIVVGAKSQSGAARVQSHTESSNNPNFAALRFIDGSGGPTVDFFKSRGATSGEHALVSSGDNLGRLTFRGSNGSLYRTAAAVNVRVDGPPGTGNDMPGRIEFETTPDGSATSQIQMVIKNSGDVGIGTTSPTDRLHVNGNAQFDGNIGISNNSDFSSTGRIANIRFQFGGNDGAAIKSRIPAGASSVSESFLDVMTGGSADAQRRLRIDEVGRVCVGALPSAAASITNVDAGLIQTDGNIDIRYGGTNNDPAGARYLSFINNDPSLATNQPMGGIRWVGNDSDNPSTDCASILAYNAGGGGAVSSIVFSNDGGTERMRISSNGRVGIGTTLPNTTLHVLGNSEFGSSTANVGSHLFYANRGGQNLYARNYGIGPSITAEHDSIRDAIRVDDTSGNTNFTVTGAGLVTAASDVQSGGNPYGGSPSAGARLDSGGAVVVARSSGDVFTGKDSGSGDVTSTIDKNGRADFGTTSLDNYAVVGFSNSAVNGGVYSQNNNTSGRIFTGQAGSTEVFVVKASGKVGVGVAAPADLLHIHAPSGSSAYFHSTTGESGSAAGDGMLLGLSSTTGYVWNYENSPILFATNDTERMRIDSSGNVGIGTTPSNLLTSGYVLRLNGGTQTFLAFNNTTHTTQGTGGLSIGNDPNNAYITQREDQPLIIATDDAEHMRITSAGYAKHSDNSTYIGNTANYHEFNQSRQQRNTLFSSTHASYGATQVQFRVTRAATSDYWFIQGISSAGTGSDDTEFYIRGDGNAFADGSWSGGGADYAEYFEWSDGNTAAKDRRGISVVLDGDKIREAVSGEEPIGVISGNPSMVGDVDVDRWKGKYLRDDYGTYIQEDYEVEDQDGKTVVQQRRKLNPDYNPDVEYVSREERAEWDCVGLMGKLRIRKGQITGSRWIKMRDISDSVEEWLIR